jgi:glycosyltransferase involved in cell wall biosynthesis
MKVGFLIISEGWAGAENAVLNISKNLLRVGIEVDLYLNEEIAENYSKIRSLNVFNLGPLFKKRGLMRFFPLLKIRKKLKKCILINQPDILVMFLDGSFIIYKNLYDKLGVPTIASLRGSEIKNFFENKGNLYERLARICLNDALNKASSIVSVSKQQIENLPRELKLKTVIIPNGVDSKIFKPNKYAKQRNNVVLFTGRFMEIKGVREILSSAKKLKKYEFWFVGKGNLENLINLPNIKNLGFKSKKELIKLYNKSTLCVAPSYREGFSNVGLEITSCGRALICTPTFSEYIEDRKNGLIIKPKDEKELRKAIVKLMENKELRKRIEKNARKKALGYSWEKITGKYISVFRRVENGK